MRRSRVGVAAALLAGFALTSCTASQPSSAPSRAPAATEQPPAGPVACAEVEPVDDALDGDDVERCILEALETAGTYRMTTDTDGDGDTTLTLVQVEPQIVANDRILVVDGEAWLAQSGTWVPAAEADLGALDATLAIALATTDMWTPESLASLAGSSATWTVVERAGADLVLAPSSAPSLASIPLEAVTIRVDAAWRPVAMSFAVPARGEAPIQLTFDGFGEQLPFPAPPA